MKSNPRFPHRCTIWRIEGATPFSQGIKTILYKGECRAYKRNRARVVDGVYRTDSNMSIPVPIEARLGDTLEVTMPNVKQSGQVTYCQVGNLGTTIYWLDDNK